MYLVCCLYTCAQCQSITYVWEILEFLICIKNPLVSTEHVYIINEIFKNTSLINVYFNLFTFKKWGSHNLSVRAPEIKGVSELFASDPYWYGYQYDTNMKTYEEMFFLL